jgi:hypothetical protein
MPASRTCIEVDRARLAAAARRRGRCSWSAARRGDQDQAARGGADVARAPACRTRRPGCGCRGEDGAELVVGDLADEAGACPSAASPAAVLPADPPLARAPDPSAPYSRSASASSISRIDPLSSPAPPGRRRRRRRSRRRWHCRWRARRAGSGHGVLIVESGARLPCRGLSGKVRVALRIASSHMPRPKPSHAPLVPSAAALLPRRLRHHSETAPHRRPRRQPGPPARKCAPASAG